jgi:hypothetical protein
LLSGGAKLPEELSNAAMDFLRPIAAKATGWIVVLDCSDVSEGSFTPAAAEVELLSFVGCSLSFCGEVAVVDMNAVSK